MAPGAPLGVLIVGCGSIAGGLDAEADAEAPPLTHAGAFTRDPRFRLAACVEPVAARRDAFMRRWAVPAGFDRVAEATAAGPFDIVSICSPTALHAEHIDAALALRPRLIFSEKPLTGSVSASAAVVERCRAQGVRLAVNHNRRWAPDIVALRDELRAGRWGRLRAAVGTYGKGVVNNGAHMVDLIHFLVGSPLRLLWAGPPRHDFWPDDPTVPAALATPDGAIVHLATGDAGDFAIFELQLILSGGVVTLEDSGLSWRRRRAVDSPAFRGYRTLDRGDFASGAYAEAMRNALNNLYDSVSSNAPLASTGETALEAQRVCESIRLHATQPGSQDQP
jgi:predicted dehydrogenase